MSRPRIRCIIIGFIALSLCGLSSLAASAKHHENKAAAPVISTAIIQAEDITPHKTTIDRFVAHYVKQLLDESDPAEQTEARNELCSVVAVEKKPSSALLEQYSKDVNKHIFPAAKHSNQRTRLNAVMVLAHVAAVGKSIHLEPAIREFLTDKNDAVALWAMKAAGAILPEIVGSASGTQFLAAIVPAAKNHSLAGMVDVSYEALSLHLAVNRPNIRPAMLQAVIPSMQQLLDYRIGTYANADPESPALEKKAIAFLNHLDVLDAMNDAQRLHTLQELIDLMSLAARRNATAIGQDRKPLIDLIKNCAQGIEVVGKHNNDDTLIKLVKDQQKVGINTPQNALVSQTQAIVDAILTMPTYNKLRQPPAIKGVQPTTAPAAAPASSEGV